MKTVIGAAREPSACALILFCFVLQSLAAEPIGYGEQALARRRRVES